MKRPIFWFLMGILAVSAYRVHSRCAEEREHRATTALIQRLSLETEDRLVALTGQPEVERESADGLPVPIVPGTRVDEAQIQTPKAPRPPRSPWSGRPRLAQTPTRTADDPALPPGTRLVKGQLSATEERALTDARAQLNRKLSEWLVPDVPPSWKVPDSLVNRLIRGEQIKPVEKEYGTLYEATLQVNLTPELRAEIVETYRRELVTQRLSVLAGLIAFILACLAALAGYIRADEATKGYYTNWLRAVAAAGVGASGVLIYQMLT